MNDEHDNSRTDREMLLRYADRARPETTPETYPKTLHALPRTIAHHTVLAWAEIPPSEGSYPGGIVLAHDPGNFEPYKTWLAYSKDGGDTWNATGGNPSFTHANAWDDFINRVALYVPATSA
jgi:hypothetical protein